MWFVPLSNFTEVRGSPIRSWWQLTTCNFNVYILFCKFVTKKITDEDFHISRITMPKYKELSVSVE